MKNSHKLSGACMFISISNLWLKFNAFVWNGGNRRFAEKVSGLVMVVYYKILVMVVYLSGFHSVGSVLRGCSCVKQNSFQNSLNGLHLFKYQCYLKSLCMFYTYLHS